jgi:hypothetical protein
MALSNQQLCRNQQHTLRGLFHNMRQVLHQFQGGPRAFIFCPQKQEKNHAEISAVHGHGSEGISLLSTRQLLVLGVCVRSTPLPRTTTHLHSILCVPMGQASPCHGMPSGTCKPDAPHRPCGAYGKPAARGRFHMPPLPCPPSHRQCQAMLVGDVAWLPVG